MSKNNKIKEFITFPKTFDNYRWFKSITVFIIGFIITCIFQLILTFAFYGAYGPELMISILDGGYEVLNTEMGQIFTDLGVIVFIPALFIASKIVKDRPFSSYASSRGGWNFNLYFKALIIPLICYLIFEAIYVAVEGPKGNYHFSWMFLIISFIFVPLQCIAEEYVFRGFLMQTFASWFNIPILAVILQAIIFALSHSYNSLGIIEVFVTGILLGFLTWKTNGIEVSSAIHTANNLTLSLFVMFGLVSSTSSPMLHDVVISIIFEVLLCILMYYIIMKTDWLSEVE